MESAPGEDAVKLVEMTTEDLEYYIIIVDKALRVWEDWLQLCKSACRWNADRQHHMLRGSCSWKEESVNVVSFAVALF